MQIESHMCHLLVCRILKSSKKNPSSFSCHPGDLVALALESQGLRMLIVALSSIILHLVSALVIPLLVAWLGVLHGILPFGWLGGEAEFPCVFWRVGKCRLGADS